MCFARPIRKQKTRVECDVVTVLAFKLAVLFLLVHLKLTSRWSSRCLSILLIDQEFQVFGAKSNLPVPYQHCVFHYSVISHIHFSLKSEP
jgi:hypothetical protein